MKKIYAEKPQILIRLLDSNDVVTASVTSYGDDNVGCWGETWFSNGNGSNGGEIYG